MKIHGFCLFLLLAALPAAAPAARPATGDDDELARKISELDDQIQDLRTRAKELLKERKTLEAKKTALQEELRKKEEENRLKEEARKQEEARRKAAEKQRHFARVVVHGKLVRMQQPNPNIPVTQSRQPYDDVPVCKMPPPPETWRLVINELVWDLDFSKHPELLTAAREFADKGVIVKGTIVNTRPVVRGNGIVPFEGPPPPNLIVPNNPPADGPPTWQGWNYPPREGPPRLPQHAPLHPSPVSREIPLDVFRQQPVTPPPQPDCRPAEVPVTVVVENLNLAER